MGSPRPGPLVTRDRRETVAVVTTGVAMVATLILLALGIGALLWG